MIDDRTRVQDTQIPSTSNQPNKNKPKTNKTPQIT